MFCVRSTEKREQTLAMPAALTVAAGAALSSPLAAQAAVTPSLKNLINSVIAGTLPGSLRASSANACPECGWSLESPPAVQGLHESGLCRQKSSVTSYHNAVSVQCTDQCFSDGADSRSRKVFDSLSWVICSRGAS